MLARLAAAVVASTIATHGAEAQELRIGFLTNFTGPGATQGVHQRNGWLLGLEHEGWRQDGDKVHGVAVKIFYGDDQAKPDLGLREIDKWLSADKVHMVVGYLWSNVLLASRKPLVEAKRVFISTVPGASPLAGKECTPYFLSAGWNNDTVPEALGKLVSDEGVKMIFALAPNYQAGKDMISGFERTFKGKIVDRNLFKLGETDFQADISKVRAAKPEAAFLFAPGPMGISFMKQWGASGANKEIKLYSVFTIDHLTLPAIGDAAIGTYHTAFWDPNSTLELNRRFIREYLAKFNHHPSMFAVPAYDTARLIAAALKAVNGKVDDSLALAKALRHTPFPSVRGQVGFNVNGFPIQDHYKREVVAGPDGKPSIKTIGVISRQHKDAYWEQCPPDQRL